MAKKTNISTNTEHSDECNYTRRMSVPVTPIVKFQEDRHVIERPARRIGELLAMQQYDGVDGTVNNLFKGQYDEKFGDVDPATDSHADVHLLQDALMRQNYNSKMTE